MKQNKFLYGALGLFALGMTACSSDMQMPDEPQVAESNQTQYVCIALSSPTQGTRAFEDGTAEEHFVKTLDFIWYDANGVPTGAQVTHIDKDGLNGDFTNQGTTTDNVTKINMDFCSPCGSCSGSEPSGPGGLSC